MAIYILKLWANNLDNSIPTVEVEADGDMKAAALGLKHFAQLGRAFPDGATIDVGKQPYTVESVFRWLRVTDEGQYFASRKNLASVLNL